MKKLRKTLGKVDSPYIVELKCLTETQSKAVLANWAIAYTRQYILPIYQKFYPQDNRPKLALDAAQEWLSGTIKLPIAKKFILEAHAAAVEAENNPAAQAAARTAGQVAATIHSTRHCMGLAFYGTAAIAYYKVGTDKNAEIYDQIAKEECKKMTAALWVVSEKKQI